MPALTSSTLSSTKWTILSSLINGIITIFIGSVLARLLTPKIYGLIAIAYLVVAFAGYFVRLGVGTALIQKEDLKSEDIIFAITFSMGIGLISAIIMALLSPIIATLFNKPESTAVIAAMSLSLWFTSFSATLIGLLKRQMLFKFLSIISIAQTVFTGIVSISFALMGTGVWSLVWPLIVGQLIVMMILFQKVKSSYRLTTRFSLSGNKSIIKIGSKYTLIGLLEYFGSNLDTIFIGRLFSTSQLGVYNRAFKLAYLPTENLITSITSVMFPVYSRLQNQNEAFKETQNRVFLLIGLFSTSISIGMIPASVDIVHVLLGPQWLSSIPILMVILIAVPFDFLSVTLGLAFDASGKLNQKMKIQFAAFMTLVIGMVILFPYGPIGIALALVLSHIIRFIYYVIMNHFSFSIPIKKTIRNVTSFIFAGACVFFVSQSAVMATNNWSFPPIPALLFEFIMCTFILTLILVFNAPTLLGVENFSQSLSKIRTYLSSRREGKHEDH